MTFDSFETHKIDMYMGNPKSGKTRVAGSYPKPLLYVSVGNDGGGRVLKTAYPEDCENGNIKVKNLRNDPFLNGKVKETTIEKLAKLLYELKQPDAPKFKTIVIDTLSALQDDYKTALEQQKGGVALSTQQWGDVAKMMMGIKDVMKKFSEDMDVQFVWITHTKELETYETSGLDKELRIIPDMTDKTGKKFMKDASNIFYCCRKTVIDNNGNRDVKFLTYVGPHPLMDTGTRDMELAHGAFVENFSYQKWQAMVQANKLDVADVIAPVAETNTDTATTEE